mmetsp:Transcript_31668/g.71395  ORF Transcript_31668/g.71395 Transcript_31668/m.71395 type:complete len:280 (+) Transcript_31668:99-938(+)
MALQEGLQVLLLVLQEVDFLLALPLVDGAPLRLAPLHRLALVLQLHDPGLARALLLFLLADHLLRLRLALLRLELLPGAESHAALVEGLVCCDGHPDLVPYAKQDQAALGAVDRDLPYQFIEALRVELLADLADPRLPRLPLHEALIQGFLELDHVEARSHLVADILAKVLPILDPLARRQQRMKHVVGVGLGLHRGQLRLFPQLGLEGRGLGGGLALAGCVERRRTQFQGRLVLDQRLAWPSLRNRHGAKPDSKEAWTGKGKSANSTRAARLDESLRT